MGHVARDADLLVLAPLFPSINQAWMDRYLEQMLDTGWRPCILSTRVERAQCNPRIRDLGLLARTRIVPDSLKHGLAAALRFAACHPVRAARIARRMLDMDNATTVGAESYRGRISMVLRSWQYASLLAHSPSLRICHAHSIDMAYPLIPVLAEAGVPLVYTFHGLKPRGVPQLDRERMREVLRRASIVLANTTNSVQQLSALGCPTDRIRIVPQGIPLDEFPFAPIAPPSEGEALRIISVGRLHADKGYGYAALALRRMRDQGQRLAWEIVGAGPHENRLRRLVERLGLEDITTFHGTMPSASVGALFRRSHIMILASLSARNSFEHVETQGVVIQEAQASGCLVVASAVGGIPECIDDGQDGFLVEERNHRALANTLRELIERPDTWKATREQARCRVVERYGAEYIGRCTDAILRATVAEMKKGSAFRAL
jgi:glycosyltransferase involved in cell wall biosynthesis